MGGEEPDSNRTNGTSPADAATETIQAANGANLDRLVNRLFTDPDISQIQPRTDPRFRWLHAQTMHEAPDATTLADVIQALRERRLDDEALAKRVAHLIEYTQSLAAEMLEDELFDIVAPLLPNAASRVPILLARLGWDSGPVRTLAEAGEAAGVTRERIRQMQLRLETKLAESNPWMPVLDRALSVVKRRTPLPAFQLGQVLFRAGLSGVGTFDAEGLIQAQALFGRSRGLALQVIEGIPFVVDEQSSASTGIADRLAAIRAIIAKRVSHQGLTSIPEIVAVMRADGQRATDHEIVAVLAGLDAYHVIEHCWIVPADTETRNPLLNRLNKLLALQPGITVPIAVAQLERDEERGYAVSEAGLRVFCRHRSDLALANDRIHPAATIDTSTVLSVGERAIVAAFRRHEADTLSFSELVDAVQDAGLSKVTASLLARRSVILRKLDRDCYALIDTLPDAHDAGANPAPTRAPDRDSGQGANNHPAAIDVAAVAVALVRRHGAVTIAEVLEELRNQGRHMGQGELLPLLTTTIDLIFLDGRWIAGSRFMRPYPVVDRTRKLLAIFPGIPLRRAASQVTRGDEIVSLPRKQAIAQLLQARDEFVVKHDQLYSRDTVSPEQTLDTAEQFLVKTLRPHPGGLPKSALTGFASDQKIPAEALDAALTTSPIVFAPRAGIFVLCVPTTQESLPVTNTADGKTSPAADAPATVGNVHPKWLQGMTGNTDRASRAAEPERPISGTAHNGPVPAPQVPAMSADTLEKSPAVRDAIKRTYEARAAATGIIALDELFREINKDGVLITRSDLVTALARIKPLAVLDDMLVASLGERQQSVLTARLRQLLAVYPRQPLAVVHAQLARACSGYKNIPIVALVAFAKAHPEFSVSADRLMSRNVLFTSGELPDEEQSIYRVLRQAAEPLTPKEIAARTSGRRLLTEDRVRALLRKSVIVIANVDGRYALLTSEVAPPGPAPSTVVTHAKHSPIPTRSDNAPPPARTITTDHDVEPSLESLSAVVESNADNLLTVEDQPCGTTSETSATIEELVKKVGERKILLPEIQRDYVWKRTQVRDLLDSLYRNFPIGAMLMWNTSDVPAARALGSRDRVAFANGERQFLLDGQQRLTSLSQVMFDGEPDIRFNLATEEFRVANATTRTDKRWVKVSDVFARTTVAILRDTGFLGHPHEDLFSERLDRLRGIRNRRVVINELTGFSYEDVTEIFIRVNSRGTRLRTAELAVAQLAFRLPGMVTDNLRGYEKDLAERGWEIDSRFLLRCLTAVATNQVTYAGLNTVDEERLRDSWERTRQALDAFLSLIGNRLGIASVDWLPSTNAFMIPVVYLTRTIPSKRDEAALLRWFLFANVRSRYSGPTETAMAQDLRILTGNPDDPFPKLIERIGDIANGRLTITERDLDEARQGSRSLFLLAFLSMRRAGAHDLWTGERMWRTNLDSGQLLTIHQIFPKTVFGRDYDQQKVNEIANLVFLSRPPSRDVTQAKSLSYLAAIPPERLEQQCVPLEAGDWHATRFDVFLRERRKKLVIAMNEVLNSPL